MGVIVIVMMRVVVMAVLRTAHCLAFVLVGVAAS
jgi:hypothetical protein